MTRRHTWNDRDKKGTDVTERKLTKLPWLGTDRQKKKKKTFLHTRYVQSAPKVLIYTQLGECTIV
jgi:hypothetical protein